MPYFNNSLDSGFFQYHHGVKQFGSRSGATFLGPNCLQRLSADNMGKELNTEPLVDTTFWLKPWLELISCGSNFFHLAKVLATTNSEPG